ncbi:MAG: hypothetical protein ABI850_03735, partial [Flavobacterium sp.]
KQNLMSLIFLHDKTTGVQIPNAHLSIAVDPSDNLGVIIKQLAFTIDNTLSTAIPGWHNELHIACSCSAAGLMLGDGINHDNAAVLFKPLRYKVGNIIIHDPAAALIYRNGNNGVLLCKRLAVSVFANVMTSASVKQLPAINYTYSNTIKALKNFMVTATWNCTGSISILNKYDEKGNGTNLKMLPISELTDFSYDFQDLDFTKE